MTNLGEAREQSRGESRFLKGLIVIVGFAVCFYLIPLVAYVWMFGLSPTNSHEKWGQFGDFIGGFLNPLYALLALLAVLLSLSLQRSDFNKEMDYLSNSSYRENLYRIIKTIEEGIERILQTDVSPPTAIQKTYVHQMAHLAKIQQGVNPKQASYFHFITQAKISGSVVEALYATLTELMEELYAHLIKYENLPEEDSKSVVEYYARKYIKLIQMFEDIGGLDPKIVSYFKEYGTRT